MKYLIWLLLYIIVGVCFALYSLIWHFEIPFKNLTWKDLKAEFKAHVKIGFTKFITED